MSSTVDRQKFLLGMRISLTAEAVMALLLAMVWYAAASTLSTYPIGLLTIAVGGLMLTIAGCIGPGRYQREFTLLLYTPRPGSSFSDEFVVSGFVMDPSIKSATVMINNQKVGTIKFGHDQTGSLTLSRRDFINSTINTIQLKTEEYTSNSNEFTLFEYSEDMTEEEIDELHIMETQQPEKSLKEAQQSYTDRVSSRIGSIAVGVAATGIANLVFGFLLDLMFGITF